MDKQQKEQEYFLARIRSLFELCERQGCPKFSDFLTEEQAAQIRPLAERSGLETLFWGGFEGALRVMLGVFPDWMEPDPEEFPIVGCTFRYPAAYSLTHRDFLGSLMAQQIRREMVGDIVVRPGETYVFADKRVEKVLLTQLDRIGRVGVQIEKGTPANFQVIQDFREIKGTLASLRLDAAVALCCGVSREKASALIGAGMVQKNHCPAENGSIQLADGDILTVRGKGKFRLETDGALTRKGRIAVRILQYL
ncbi:MAG TPA: RNA-binding protein [Candidatus Merdivicinus excrementipullorum]|uniref:RNA-binding protein n=1 Tax=Candidatus Merdivicinus excrementipullorum TaxID=2840867 RepID=A0A9D1FNH2_9FIRM|nr:RNA-binding protein [Candidatus Merdivicinus excrementipullorum]